MKRQKRRSAVRTRLPFPSLLHYIHFTHSDSVIACCARSLLAGVEDVTCRRRTPYSDSESNRQRSEVRGCAYSLNHAQIFFNDHVGGQMMLARKILVSALLAAGTIVSVATPLPSAAASSVDVQLDFGPPPPRYEPAPAPRRGYVWSPGYWRWNGHRHMWVGGHWERARPGYAYRAPEWVEREGRWHYQPPRWDRDGDGIPNRRDQHPDNPYRG